MSEVIVERKSGIDSSGSGSDIRCFMELGTAELKKGRGGSTARITTQSSPAE